jgi:hypothetical protein
METRKGPWEASDAAKKDDVVCPFLSVLVFSSHMVWYLGSGMGINTGMNNGIKFQDQSAMS